MSVLNNRIRQIPILVMVAFPVAVFRPTFEVVSVVKQHHSDKLFHLHIVAIPIPAIRRQCRKKEVSVVTERDILPPPPPPPS